MVSCGFLRTGSNEWFPEVVTSGFLRLPEVVTIGLM